MQIKRPRPYRLHWSRDLGWVLDVDDPLPDSALQAMVRWAVPRQIERWRGLPPGERKDELERAIGLLRAGKVTQRVVPDRDGGAVVFASTLRSNPERTITYGPGA